MMQAIRSSGRSHRKTGSRAPRPSSSPFQELPVNAASFRQTSACFVIAIVLAVGFFVSIPSARADEKTDQAAAALLAEAKKAFNEKQFAPARDRFKQFISTHGANKDINTARLGLALVILEGPRQNGPDGMDRDYPAAIESLKLASGDAAFPDRAMALYYLGIAQRDLGLWHLTQLAAKPNETAQRTATATQQFEAALKPLTDGVAAFVERAKATPAAPTGDLPADYEWAARARCDIADVLIRIGKAREAMVIAQPFLKDAILTRSQSRDTGRYLHGLAAFVAGDFMTAARSLAQLAPFKQPEFGIHARYLLARIHHMAEERPEAAALYLSVMADHEADFRAARHVVNDANALRDNPRERSRLESLARNAYPEHYMRAWFYYASLLLEQDKPAAAAELFVRLTLQSIEPPLLAEATLRLGMCYVKTKQYSDAIRMLTSFQDDAALEYEVRWIMGRAMARNFDPNNAQQKKDALAAAIVQLATAAQKAGQKDDAKSKADRPAILLELADTLLAAGQPKESAASYQKIISEKSDAPSVEQAHQRLVTALHLAGAYKESDAAAALFEKNYPRSMLLAPVLFRHAENSFVQAELAAKHEASANKPEVWTPLYSEAIVRYAALLKRYPDFAQADLARLGQGMSFFRLGQYDKAAAALGAIGMTQRSGDLATASFVQADCLLRLAPTNVNDAINAGKALQLVSEAIKLLEAFIPGNEAKPEGAIATLQVAEGYQRIAAIMADPQEKAKALTAALAIFQGFPAKFGANHALLGEALLGRCNTLVMQGDMNGAISRLPRFQNQDPYPRSPVAPLALTRLAMLMQSQNQHEQAATLLQTVRQQHEAALLKDARRSAWVPMMQYQHATALRSQGKQAEALTLFENITKQFPMSAEAVDAAWRIGQVRFDLANASIASAKAILVKAGAKPEEIAAANTTIQAATQSLTETAVHFEALAKGQNEKSSEQHLRLLYEAAWVHRTLGNMEVQAAIDARQSESIAKLEPLAQAAAQPNQPAPKPFPVDVAIASIALQPSQKKSIETYAAIIEASSDAPLALLARLEQAEIYASRGQHDAAIPLLAEAIDLEPEQPLLDRIHLRLGACLLDKGDTKAAIEQFAPATQNKNPVIFGEANFRLAQVKIIEKDFNGAINLLTPFRDKGEFQNIPGISERALLSLGHAYAYANQHEPSRQALETLFNRFGNSPLRFEARFGFAQARQQQKNWDDAINHYREAIKAAAIGQSELAARAQLNMGICFNEKKQFAEAENVLLPISYLYDYPDHTAAALLEAARAKLGLQKKDEAKALLERVIKSHPNSHFAEAAQERLDQLK